MTNARRRLPNRRNSVTFDFEANGLFYCCTVSYYPDGALGEIFISNAKVNSHSDCRSQRFCRGCVAGASARRAAGDDPPRALRDARGVASSPLGVALDAIKEGAS